MSQRSKKTFDDVRTAFESRSILNASPRELEELLAAIASETIDDPATRARVREMGETMRQLHAARSRAKPSRVAIAAAILAVAALATSGAQFYRTWSGTRGFAPSSSFVSQTNDAVGAMREASMTDLRTHHTIAELAKRAPSLRTGNVQAWWAGEQARQVQKLEAQAKRQALAGDRDGAARSASRADAIRSRIPALADFERPSAQ